MSVLFEALRKAARDHRRQKTPVLVPLVTPSSRAVPVGSRRSILLTLVFLACAAIGATFLALRSDAPTAEKSSVEMAAAAPKPDGRSEAHLFKNARKMRDDEPFGIALSANSGETEERAGKAAKASKSAEAVEVEPDPIGEEGAAARRSIQVSESDDAGSPDAALLDLAQKALKAKQWAKALGLYNQLLKDNRGNDKAFLGKVAALEGRGSDGDLEALDALAESRPSVAAIHAARARLLIHQEDTVEALSAWQKAVALEPEEQAYRLGLAVLYDKLGRTRQALDAYRVVPAPLPAEARRRMEFLSAREAQSVRSASNEQND